MPECFVIMPISTPEHLLEVYGNDQDHFKSVLEKLFSPAIEAAGHTVIPPSVPGSEVIQAEIIGHLEKSDLVLCDISSLNPNVFFELGMRTAFNKPVAMVRDRLTPNIPFDTGMIGHHTYHERPTWTLEQEVEALTEHIKTAANSGSENALWKHFGIQLQAVAPDSSGNESEKIDYIVRSLEQLREQRTSPPPSMPGFADPAFFRMFGAPMAGPIASSEPGSNIPSSIKNCAKCRWVSVNFSKYCSNCGEIFP